MCVCVCMCVCQHSEWTAAEICGVSVPTDGCGCTDAWV